MSTTSPTGERDDHTEIIDSGREALSIVVLFVPLGVLRRLVGGCVKQRGPPWLTTIVAISL
jgi:hypothetical protein